MNESNVMFVLFATAFTFQQITQMLVLIIHKILLNLIQ